MQSEIKPEIIMSQKDFELEVIKNDKNIQMLKDKTKILEEQIKELQNQIVSMKQTYNNHFHSLNNYQNPRTTTGTWWCDGEIQDHTMK